MTKNQMSKCIELLESCKENTSTITNIDPLAYKNGRQSAKTGADFLAINFEYDSCKGS